MKNLRKILPVKKGKVLIMDEEEVIIDVVSELLSSNGYEVGISRNGIEALELYEIALESGEPYDVVLMELVIGDGIGGREAVRELLEIDPDAKAIALSVDSDNPVITNFRAYGFKDAIVKPCKTTEILETVSNVIEEG